MESFLATGVVFTTEIYRHKLMSKALESGDPDQVLWAASQANGFGADYDLIETDVSRNIIPDEGLNDMLNVWLNSGTQVGTRYIAIFSSDSTPASSWTSANFHGTNCTEWEGYSESVRQTWQKGAVSSKSISNSSNKAVFTSSGSANLYGAALLSASAKDGTGDAAGKLYAATRYTAYRSVQNTDVVNVQYTISASSS